MAISRAKPGDKLWFYFTPGVDYGMHRGFECGFWLFPQQPNPNHFGLGAIGGWRFDVTFRLPHIRWNWPWLRMGRGPF